MDDDDDIRSPATISSSPSPSPPPTDTLPQEVNSRALVVTPLQLPRTTATAVAVNSGGRSGGGGREDCWSEGATGVLIDAWGERYLELSRGNLKQKHWKEVAEIVSSREDYSKPAKTDIQCKNRIDTVKKKYKLEKAKIAAGGGPSRWGFFERLDDLIGPNAKVTPPGGGGGGSSSGDGGPSVALFGNVPLGIPVPTGIRSTKHYPRRGRGSGSDDGRNPNRNGRTQIRKQQGRSRVESEEEEEDDEEAEGEGEGEGEGYSDDSLPPVEKRQRVRVGVSDGKKKEGRKGWGSSSSVRLLEEAMCKFGDAYERAERAKLQQVMEMEKTRMKFLKELELQRMQFFMKTQMEISQLRHGRTQTNASHQQHYNHSNRHPGNNVNNNK